MRLINFRFAAARVEDGLDVAWLKSLEAGPQSARGRDMPGGLLKKLSNYEIIRPAGKLNGFNVWAPGKLYRDMLEALP